MWYVRDVLYVVLYVLCGFYMVHQVVLTWYITRSFHGTPRGPYVCINNDHRSVITCNPIIIGHKSAWSSNKIILVKDNRNMETKVRVEECTFYNSFCLTM